MLMGNLTRDPELKTLPSGMSVARLSLAVNRSYTDKDGAKKEEVTFVDVDAFGKQAEVIGKYFAKGKPILVEGRLKLDQWEDKNTGEKRSRLGVVLENFSFVGTKAEGGSESGGDDGHRVGASVPPPRGPTKGGARPTKPPPRDTSMEDDGEEVPF